MDQPSTGPSTPAVPAATPVRWSRRIAHPQLSVTTDAPPAVVDELAASLRQVGFRVTAATNGFRAHRRPWLDWLATAPAAPCILTVTMTGPGTVVVDVERTGAHPAPRRVADALAIAARGLAERSITSQFGTWRPAP